MPQGGFKHDVRGIRRDGEDDRQNPPVPIFLLFKDRVSVLLETIRSLHRHIRTPFEIVIFDDHSTYAPAVNFLNRMAEAGVHVYRNKKKWQQFDDVTSVISDFIIEYMQTSSLSKYFVLTDPDCALDSAPGDILLVFQAALKSMNLRTIGSAIRWDDWPQPWPRYEQEFMHATPKVFQYPSPNNRTYYYINAPVDTTFAMYPWNGSTKAGTVLVGYNSRRKDLTFRNDGKDEMARMLPPLGIRHLDFYFEGDQLPQDYRYYLKQVRPASCKKNANVASAHAKYIFTNCTTVNHMFHVDV